MKQRRCLKSIVFIAFILIIFFICIGVNKKRETEIDIEGYADYQQNKFDVVFLGSSIMKNAVYPMELYHE